MTCYLCPRSCGADRTEGQLGFCGMPDEIYVAKIMRHEWEEPVICHGGGAGAIFFSGCNLRCCFCQNKDISRNRVGNVMTVQQLAEEMLKLQSDGVVCIDLVTPTHYADKIAEALKIVKPHLQIPVVYNCGGYEKAETLKMLSGLVDIYMPDFKYFSSELSLKYSAAPDYCDVALSAIKEMFSQVGDAVLDENGHMKKGLIVRHLVLPGARLDSVAVLEVLAKAVPPDKIFLSLMSQYTPDFANDSGFKELNRRITSFEYNKVLDRAIELGFDGFMQERSSAAKNYTPDFK